MDCVEKDFALQTRIDSIIEFSKDTHKYEISLNGICGAISQVRKENLSPQDTGSCNFVRVI